MKRLALLLGILVLTAAVAIAAAPNTYQVTGPVLEVKGDVITVQKGSEKWEIARDKDTKVTGDPKVGSKVTIKYQMKATSIDVKPDGKGDAKDGAKAEEKGKAKKK